MKRTLLLLAAAGLSMSLAACSSHSSSSPPPPPPPTPKLEDKFGANFGQDFRQPSNATAAPVKSGDVIPVDPTASPQSLKQ